MRDRPTYRNAFSRPYRVVAMILCVLYLGGPLKDPMGFGLHQIAHSLEQPIAVLGHEVNGAHTSWEHEIAGEEHEHSLVDAVTTFFEALDKHDQQQEIPPSMSLLDKHIPMDVKFIFNTGRQSPYYPELKRIPLSEGISLIEIPPPIS